MKKTSILIVAPEALMRRSLQILVQSEGFEAVESSGADILSGSWKQQSPDLIISYVSGENPEEGLELSRRIKRRDLRQPIILITSHSSEEMAVEALRIGVSDYLKLPVSPQDLVSSINRCLVLPQFISDAELVGTAPDLASETRMVGRSSSIVGITAFLRKVAMTDCTVLIAGETGTGKELVVNLIHQHSPRSQQPLVVINCAAIPDTLLESELFGHERGAFTGAYTRQQGAMQAANRGTLFLDEIGDMSPIAQAKILRAIENKEVCPVGGRKSTPIDVRIVAATNKNLEQMVKTGEFRADLYYRLNLVRISVPPLRERQEDIELLLDHYRRILNRKFGKQVEGFTEEAIVTLTGYEWPGNVRELKNFLEATFINAPSRIGLNDFPPFFVKRLQEPGSNHKDERNRLLKALFDTNWNKARAAQQLQWSRMTLYRKMAKYQLNPVPTPEPTERYFSTKGEYPRFVH
jgi:DNA-binding NtrC family response regulator